MYLLRACLFPIVLSLLWLSPQGTLTTIDGYQLAQDSFAYSVAPERQYSDESDDGAVTQNHTTPCPNLGHIVVAVYFVDTQPHKQTHYVRGPPLSVA